MHFSSDATETMEDKILRLIRNEADTNEPKCGTTDAARCCTRKIPVALPLARNRATWYNGYATPVGLQPETGRRVSDTGEFVDRVIVHAPDRSTGERVQEVDVYLKFIGKFDIPQPEPTAEELEKLEKDRQRRAYNREKSRRCALRKKQKEAVAV